MTGGFTNLLANATADPGMGVVVGLGVGTVFAGLVCLVLLLSIFNWIFAKIQPKSEAKAANTVTAAPAAASDEKMDDETVAAVSAAIAETLGRDVSGIRITSIKKVN